MIDTRDNHLAMRLLWHLLLGKSRTLIAQSGVRKGQSLLSTSNGRMPIV